jgi:hypothetical protein
LQLIREQLRQSPGSVMIWSARIQTLIAAAQNLT